MDIASLLFDIFVRTFNVEQNVRDRSHIAPTQTYLRATVTSFTEQIDVSATIDIFGRTPAE